MSFLSIEPQSRAVLESHSNNLLAQFDTQLRITAGRYLDFFQERRSIEATYIDSLWELHCKAKVVDTSFDSRIEPTTTREAWFAIRDNLESEATIQQGFMDILDNNVIKPLTTLKKSKDETRKRIEEDLKRSAEEYAHFAENTIAPLQQAYLEKCPPRKDTPSTYVSRRPQDVPNKIVSKVSGLFRGLREDSQEPVFDDGCREAVGLLNVRQSTRAEVLGDGYDCLQDLVFTPTVKDVLVKYLDGIVTACAKYGHLAINTKAKVEKALAGTDAFDLKESLRRTLSSSIPPIILYRNNRPGAYSDLVFGVPPEDLETNREDVPKVIIMCIEEIEKRGLNTKKIYSARQLYDTKTLKLRRRFESEKSFSFKSTDSIRSVAKLLMLYLFEFPGTMFSLSLQDYRHFIQNRARYAKNDFSLLRSKIRELHPVYRASLGALLQHLLLVASHSDKNAMTVEALVPLFFPILGGIEYVEGNVDVKKLVMEDLIRNARTLFDEGPSLSSPVTSPYVAETTSTDIYGSSFSSPEFPQYSEAKAVDSTAQHHLGIVDGAHMSTQPSFSSFPLDVAMERHLTPTLTPLLSPRLGLLSSQTLTGVETTTQERFIPKARGSETVEILPKSAPPEVVSSLAPTFIPKWRLQVPQSHPAEPTIPQSPSESVISSTSDFPFSSATSLQTAMGRFS